MNGAAKFLESVFESAEAKKMLEDKKVDGAEYSVPDLAGAVIALLDAGDSEALKLLGELLREDPPSETVGSAPIQSPSTPAQPDGAQT